MGHACFQFRTPRGTPRGATRKKRDMPASSSELHAGSHQKMIPARHRRLRYLARHIPAALPARHRSLQPAKPAPHRGRNSDFALHRGRNSDFALHQGRNSDFAFARKTHHRASAEGPGVMLSSQHNSRSVFSTIHTPCRQSWRGHRIATLNPGVGTGLPHSILAWAQDCPGVSQKTLEAQCCTALRPQTRRPDCAENTGSASVHSDVLPDSPPGLPGKLRQRPAV